MTKEIKTPPIMFLFVKPFGKVDNELWKIASMRDTLTIHVVEPPETEFSNSYIIAMAIKLNELDYKRGFDYMICYHKESEDDNSKNVLVLHTTDEIFAKLKEEMPMLSKVSIKESE